LKKAANLGFPLAVKSFIAKDAKRFFAFDPLPDHSMFGVIWRRQSSSDGAIVPSGKLRGAAP
jgi:hypothetical protein